MDVAVVGGGIAGLTAAWLLRRAGKRVAVLEMNRLLSGQTGADHGPPHGVLDTPVPTLRSDFGEKGAAWRPPPAEDLEQIAELVQELGVDCGFQRVPVPLCGDGLPARELEKEVTAAREAGFEASLHRDVPLPYPVKGALRLENQALIHPRTYLLALAERLEKEGCLLFEETRVVDVQDGVPCRVVTDRAPCWPRTWWRPTTTPLNRVFLHTKLYAYRTYSVAGPLEAPLESGPLYDSQEPYHYIRPQRIDGVDYLIVGGEDHKVGRRRTRRSTSPRWRRTRGATSPSPTHPPLVRPGHRARGRPGVHRPQQRLAAHVRGHGLLGHGHHLGDAVGICLLDLISGRENPYAALDDATRVKVWAGAKDFIQENAEVAFRFVADRLSRPDGRGLSEVAPGEGKISRWRAKVAVYREENGAAMP